MKWIADTTTQPRDEALSRRTVVAGVATGLTASLAGCTDSIPFVGSEPMEFGADSVSIGETARSETGYEERSIEEVEIEETFEAGGQSQDVLVTNWQAEYDKSIDVGGFDLPLGEEIRGAIVTALSTPQVSVLGRTFNPVADKTSDELAEMVQDQYDGIDDVTKVGEESVTIVGESTTVGEFEATADFTNGGVEIDVTLHVAEAVESGDDLIVGVGGYPTRLRAEEHQHVFRMFEGIEH